MGEISPRSRTETAEEVTIHLALASRLWHTVSVVICPHCQSQTAIPGGFDSIDVGRFTCEHCRTEFLIIDNIPMTEVQYRKGSTVQ